MKGKEGSILERESCTQNKGICLEMALANPNLKWGCDECIFLKREMKDTWKNWEKKRQRERAALQIHIRLAHVV